MKGWGQFDSKKLTALFRELDDTRLIDSASGWFDRRQGDFKSEHNYFAKQFVTPSDRAFVISEYGATPARSKDIPAPARHTDIKSALHRKNSRQPIINLCLKKSTPSKNRDCCGAVYTQLSDIEDEINGLMTYDREVCKL